MVNSAWDMISKLREVLTVYSVALHCVGNMLIFHMLIFHKLIFYCIRVMQMYGDPKI